MTNTEKYKKKDNLRIFLIWLMMLISISAVFGGIGLLVTNGLGIPVSWLAFFPFSDFLIPGLILFFIVGGTNIFAAFSLMKKYSFALEATAMAGFGLQIWVFTELYITRQSHWLQVVYFLLGTIVLISTLLLQKHEIYYTKTR